MYVTVTLNIVLYLTMRSVRPKLAKARTVFLPPFIMINPGLNVGNAWEAARERQPYL